MLKEKNEEGDGQPPTSFQEVQGEERRSGHVTYRRIVIGMEAAIPPTLRGIVAIKEGRAVATPKPLKVGIDEEGNGHPLICPSVWKKRRREVAMTKKEEGRRSSHPPIPQGRIMPRREVAIPSIH